MPLPIVLMHAFPLSSQMWQPLRAVLPGDFELITPDFRGAGGELLGADPPSLDLLADDVAALLDSRGIARAIVGGLSMGGYVTMALLRRHARRVAGVVLADTKAEADSEPARINRERIASIAEEQGNSRVLVDEVLPTLLGSTTLSSRADVLASVRSMVSATLPSAAAWWERAMATRPDSFETLRSVPAPALVILGEEDQLVTPAQAAAMAEALPDARLAELPAAGHLSAVETPEAFGFALPSLVDRVASSRPS
jgi:pimeloyl-ACP methyl ester carboxylesterase